MKFNMNPHSIFFFLSLILSASFSSSAFYSVLSEGSSLSVEHPENVLISPHGVFSAGFYPAGINAYYFAIWFSKPTCNTDCTVIWMANRDSPVNGKRSEFSLLKTGNLILTDAGLITTWSVETFSVSWVQLLLHDTGNLVLKNAEGVVLWQSFDSPTDTLLPLQQFTRDTELVSSRSRSNHSSGFYKFFFDTDNTLRLLYNGPEVSSIYWYDPWLVNSEAGRSAYNNTRIASLDSLGKFSSSDAFTFLSADYGASVQRRLTMDFDGNIRLYSREEGSKRWVVQWQAITESCMIHGICGPNSLCSYDPYLGRKCSCLPGFKMKDPIDWPSGCVPDFRLSCNSSEFGYIRITTAEFYGYDLRYFGGFSFQQCKELCSNFCNCQGFQYRYVDNGYCYLKNMLLNGHRKLQFPGDLHVKIPKTNITTINMSDKRFGLDCSKENLQQLDRVYIEGKENGALKVAVLFAYGMGGLELCIFLIWIFLIRNLKGSTAPAQGYNPTPGFKRFTYAELKKATRNFSEEIGRGAYSTVYKGVLSCNRVGAIKRLNDSNEGEAEFLAEVNTIEKLNHMNLIEIWGYCAERKHRLLVYEFMEKRSLAENLASNALDWQKRYEIALGTARGLAYLHEECLEWVLHCDVKPQNILLDSNYQPKVSDFGLSKLLDRGDNNNPIFSKIRGTRGYMAPEWVFNQPITSKVDVYSYGIVVLELVTGKSPATEFNAMEDSAEMEDRRLVTWVRQKKAEAREKESSWIEEVADPWLEGQYEVTEVETLVSVALKCVEEDKDARPSMSNVVEMLMCLEG